MASGGDNGTQGELPFRAGQKGGRLTGGAVTLEVLESSSGVLAPNQHGQIKGLQQFYTPVCASNFIARVTGRKLPTLDLTAGDGALLAPVEETYRYGVEIDADQIASAKKQGRPYRALHGDVTQLYSMMAALGARFRVVLLNPPFGLPWSVPGLAPKGGSAELTLLMGRGLLATGGMGVVICGAERFDRELRPILVDALFAVVRVDDLFPGTKLPCSIAFWREGGMEEWRKARAPAPLEVQAASAAELDAGLAEEIRGVQERRFGYWSTEEYNHYGTPVTDRLALWSAIQEEHDKRRAGKVRAEGVAMAGRKLKVKLSAYHQLSVVAEDRERLRWFSSFDGQPPNYFALRPKEWLELKRACAKHSIPLAPTVTSSVERVLVEARQVTCPLYPVAPAQRLAFLVDLDEIRCKRSDAKRGYVAGVTYPITCRTEVNAAKETRERQTVEGPEAYEVVVERKALQIQVGDHKYDEGTEAMKYLLRHFEIPDPGDLSSQFPREVAFWTKILQQVEREIQAREPGFRFRTFQLRDMARLLVKISNKLGGVLAWEMGLGKALAQGAMARALEIAGKLWDGCALFVMPQDLVPQFTVEMRRFFGVDLLPVGSAGRQIDHKAGCPGAVRDSGAICACGGESRKGLPGERTAVEISAMVAARRQAARGTHTIAQRDALSVPKVWAVTWFEALAVTGRLAEELPAVHVAPYRHCVEEPRPASDYFDQRTWKRVELPAKAGKYEWRWSTSALRCPRCGSDSSAGWNGEICRATLRGDGAIRADRRLRAGWARDDAETAPKLCGYVHRRTLRKPAYSVLADVFKGVFLDEGTKIQGDDSLTSKALRAFKAPFRCLSTGTPMKNYVHQMYWLLWWALGDSTPRFPYAYRGGSEKFLEDFGVTETACDNRGNKERGARPRVLPEVSNLLYLWKMLCGSVVRRRMDEVGAVVALDGAWSCRACGKANRADVGDPWMKPALLECACGEVADAIVPLIFKPVDVPFGRRQKAQYKHWLSKSNFAKWFLSTHPDSPLAQTPNAVELLAASIGQLAKLEYATVDPTGDRDWDDTHAWTPSRLKALQLAEEMVRKGHQVLYGSCLVAPGRWMADRLQERGINAVHLTDMDSDGRARTRSPKARAKAVMEFRAGKAQVLCASLNAMALGHNLDVASVVIVEGLPWDFMVMDQFIKRARRLTSKRPVLVYVLMPTESLSTRKYSLLGMKGDSADLALDGKIAGRVESRIDKARVLRDLISQGVKVDGTEIPEEQVHEVWMRMAA